MSWGLFAAISAFLAWRSTALARDRKPWATYTSRGLGVALAVTLLVDPTGVVSTISIVAVAVGIVLLSLHNILRIVTVLRVS
jgi:hypothetical protein